MTTTVSSINRKSPWPYLFAVVFHLALGFFLFLIRIPNLMDIDRETVEESVSFLTFRLIPPSEGNMPVFMVSSNPNVMPPEGSDNLPDATVKPKGPLELPSVEDPSEMTAGEIAEFLAKDREQLRKELERKTETAMAAPLPQTPLQTPSPDSGHNGRNDKGPEGAIRELDLEGFPQSVVDDIMKRYHLRIVTRRIPAGRRGQNFLSSATRGDDERYFGGMTVPAGVYEVFQLSRESVALMSRLEEEALKAKGFEPLQSRVIRIVFGIVQNPDGEYVLGVKSLKAERVAP